MTSPTPTLLVRNVSLGRGETIDIVVADDTIVHVGAALGVPDSARVIDGEGMLALPSIVNAHAHVDKSWWGLPWESYGGAGGVQGRIEHERAERDRLGIPSETRSRQVLEQFVRHGTTVLRTHVDVDLGVGLDGIAAVKDAVASFGGALQVEIVAFPQDGVLRRDGVAALLEQAAKHGAEHIGGLDPASIDRDPVGQIETLVGIAERTGCGIDIHLHDPAELGAFQIEVLIDRVERSGLTTGVNIAHGFAIAQLDASRRRDLLHAMAACGMTMTTVAPLRLPQLPLAELDDAGVPFGFGTDGIRDLWSPYGTGDTLGIAWQFARASSLVRDAELERVVEIATSASGSFAGVPEHGIAPGNPAHFFLVEAEHGPDALVRMPERRVVVGNGTVLVEAGEPVWASSSES